MTIRLPRRWTPAGAPTERGFSAAPDFAPRRRTSGFPSGDIVRTLDDRRLPAVPTENSPPVISAISDRVEYPTLPIRDIAVTVTDPDPEDTVTVLIPTLPAGVTYDPSTSVIRGTIDEAQAPGPVRVLVFASDGKTTTVTQFVIWVGAIAELSGLRAFPVPNLTVERGDRVVIPLRFLGADAPTISVMGLPAGLRLIAQRAEISGTISASAAQVAHTVVVSFDGGENDVVEIQFVIVVRSAAVVANPPPLIGSPGSFRYRRGATISTITITVEENDSGTITIAGLPPGLSAVTTSSTATVTGTISDSATLGAHDVTITADDGVNPASTLRFQITVDARQVVPLPDSPEQIPELPALPTLECVYTLDEGLGRGARFFALRQDVPLGAGMVPPDGWNWQAGKGEAPLGESTVSRVRRTFSIGILSMRVAAPAPTDRADAVIRRVNSVWNLIPPEAGLFWFGADFYRTRSLNPWRVDFVTEYRAQRYVTDRWKAENPRPPSVRTVITPVGVVSVTVSRFYGGRDGQVFARIRPSNESYNQSLRVRLYGLPRGMYWRLRHGGSNPNHRVVLFGEVLATTAVRDWNIVLSVTDGTLETRQSLTLRVVDSV